jgi:probable addiction module antidote protein
MSKPMTRPFDAANYLNSEEEMAQYLSVVLEDGDTSLLAAALGDIARARGMTQLARDTGLSRESLYKSLSGERAPNADTLFKVIRALGYELNIRPSAHP